MQGFNGFPSGKVKSVKVPVTFFSDLLPIVDHLAELKVTIYCIWALQQQESKYRYVRFSDIVADEIFMAGLSSKIAERKAILQDALERAVVRGTLFHVTVHLPNTQDEIYFMNTPDGRIALDALEKGSWVPGDAERPVQMITERPTIFALYEQNIGNITPLISDQLRDAEQEYPEGWIKDAIQIAVDQNKRSWSYVRAILDRWMREGKGKNGFSR
ncbi:MAG: DnaD domain protein [Chloroflexi bacterium]|nr:DnaD domain protein [Chloroflexota bacterium]